MRGQNAKFLFGSLIILAVLAWLALSGYQESKTYYLTLPELNAQGDDAQRLRLRVAGNVLPGSIERRQGRVQFTIYQDDLQLPVVYAGSEPLPDTLVDDAQAIVTGRYAPEHLFHAEQVQAKCASKYEALPVAPAAGSANPSAGNPPYSTPESAPR